jgi:hypothetical protein
MMDEAGWIYDTIAGSGLVAIGLRLIHCARRQADPALRLLAAHCVLAAAAQTLHLAPRALGYELEVDWNSFAMTGRVLYAVALVPLLIFVRRSFRPGTSTSTAVVTAAIAVMLAGLLGCAWRGDWYGVIENPWFQLELVGYALPYAWLAVEIVLSSRRSSPRPGSAAERRSMLALGAWAGLQLLSVGAEALTYAEYQHGHSIHGWSAPIHGALELAALAALWLAFSRIGFGRGAADSDPVPGGVAESV